MPATSHKFDSLFSPKPQAPASLHSANSPTTLSSPSLRQPQLRHRRSMSSLRDMDRGHPASSPLREAHHPIPSSAQQHSRNSILVTSMTPQSAVTQNKTTTDSIHTSTGIGSVVRDLAVAQVPDDQRDPLYYDPLPTLAAIKAHVAATTTAPSPKSHSRAPSTTSTAPPPFPASANSAQHMSRSLAVPSTSPLPPTATDQIESTPYKLPSVALPNSLYYSEPLFVFPHFFGTQPDKPHRVDRFMPRARCYELFSQGLGEKIPLSLPLLKFDPAFNAIATTGGDLPNGRDVLEGMNGIAGEKGFLDEMEDKLKRREMFDAAALGVQDSDPVTSAGLALINDEGKEPGNGATELGGGIVIGRKGNWGVIRRDPTSGRDSTDGGISEEVSTGGESYSGHDSESTSVSGGEDSHGSLSEKSIEESSNRTLSRKESESEGDDSAFGIGMPSVMVAAAQSDARHSRQQRTGSISTTASSTREANGETGRGRQSMRYSGAPGSHTQPLPSNDSGGRSKTPVPKHRKSHQPRDSSVAASVRTTTSMKNATIRKASTPALIARLTGGPAPSRPDLPDLPPPAADSSASASASASASPSTAMTSPSNLTVPLPRPSWLSLFSRTNSSASTATITPSTVAPVPAPTAPQVAVARVDVQASLKSIEAASSSTAGSMVGSPVLSTTSISERRSSATREQVEAELAVAASNSTPSQPSQPITIGSKAGSTSGRKAAGRLGGTGKANGEQKNLDSKKQDGTAATPGQISGSLKAYEPGEAMRKGLAKGGGRISVAARFNPSKPGKRSVGLADQARRWAGILVVERRNMRLGVKWRSITRGACLPITTDYIPSSDVLSREYSEYRYSIPTNSVTSSFLLRPDHPKRSHILTLVTELICQRLSHGFQIYTPAPSRSNPEPAKTLPDVLHEIQIGETTAVYLSLSNQVHRIWYDRRSKSIFVKILRRRRTWAKPEYPYQPLIWTQGADRADVTPISCPYPSMVDPVEWQHCDRLVAGAETHETDQTVRYRSTRLVLLPALKVPDREYIIGRTKALQSAGDGGVEVSDQMIQEQGFYAMMDLVENARWSPSGVEKVPIMVHQTTLDAPSWASAIAKQSVNSQPPSNNASPALGPTQRLPTTVVAKAGWLSRMQSKRGEDSQPATPMLVDRSELFDLASPPSGSSNPPNLSLPESITHSYNGSTLGKGDEERDAEERAKRPVPTIKMTHAVVLDLDPAKRSERSERVICHLDRSHNVQAAYHLELAWLTASGKIVDNAIQTWSRQMARYGVTLIEVSTRPVLARHNPFQKPIVIRPCLLPPPGSGTQERYLSHVLRSLDFFLDLASDQSFPPRSELVALYSYRRAPVHNSQYIHRSGSGIVSIVTNDTRHEDEDDSNDDEIVGFAWIPNRIFTSHHPSVDENGPRRQLEELCRNEAELRRLYEQLD